MPALGDTRKVECKFCPNDLVATFVRYTNGLPGGRWEVPACNRCGNVSGYRAFGDRRERGEAQRAPVTRTFNRHAFAK